MEPYDACTIKIYKKPEDHDRYYCRVIAGKFTHSFEPVRKLYDIPLNGPGRNKAIRKLRRRLAMDGMTLRRCNEDVFGLIKRSY